MERTLSWNAVAKKYDEAFKRQAVELVLQGGKTVMGSGRGSWGEPILDLPVEKEVLPAGRRAGIDGKTIRLGRIG